MEKHKVQRVKDFIHKMGICLKRIKRNFCLFKNNRKANLTTDLKIYQKQKQKSMN